MSNWITVDFHISDAGMAGDEHKLLVGTVRENGNKHYQLVNHSSVFSIKRGKKKIIKEIIALNSVEINLTDKYYREE